MSSYREQMQAVLQARLEKNRRYSLRAFARDLNLDPGQLSLVLKGKKNISLPKASELAQKLFESSREMQVFYHSVELELSLTDEQKILIQKKIQNLTSSPQGRSSTISEDEFEIISHWYNIAILELTGISHFEVTVKSAAEYFGISTLEASLGLQALTRLGFVKKTGDSYTKIKSLITTTEIPSFAIRRYHQQMMSKSQKALFHQEVKKRYCSGITFSIPADKIDEFKKLVDEHEQRILELANSFNHKPKQTIYQMSTQLISLDAKDYSEN